jgi:cysteine desulfurase
LEACQLLRRRHRFHLVVLPVDQSGRVDMDRACSVIDDRTLLVSVQLANGETGTLQPVPELARLAHRYGALMHTDACQAVGKVPVDVAALGVDLLSLAGHKMYAPKGVAALYRRPGVHLEPLVPGGGQEHGMRCGTENVPYLVGLGKASEIAARLAVDTERIRSLRDGLFDELQRRLEPRVMLNGDKYHQLPNTLNVSIEGVRRACPSRGRARSGRIHGFGVPRGCQPAVPVLTAMGLSAQRARAAVRLSVGRTTTAADIRRAAAVLARSVDAIHALT